MLLYGACPFILSITIRPSKIFSQNGGISVVEISLNRGGMEITFMSSVNLHPLDKFSTESVYVPAPFASKNEV